MGLAFAACAPVAAFAKTPAAGAVITAQAYVEYQPFGIAQVERANSNAVRANVLAVESLVLTAAQNVNRPPNVTATLGHLLTNTGNLTSSYSLSLASGGTGCPATSFSLASLKLVRDINGNGVADAADPVLPLGAAGALQLAPGEAASLLVQGVTPNSSNGTGCVVLAATTALQAQSASNVDVVQLSNAAVVTLSKSASYAGVMQPDVSVVQFDIRASNIGVQDALGTPTVSPVATPIMVDGAARTLLLVRDVIPSGLQYVAGSLASAAGGALRLFRLPGDSPFNYRAGADDASAIEVAIGVPAGLVSDGSMSMRFSAKVLSGAPDYVVNEAQSYYYDGAASARAGSNTAIVPITAARIGLAKAAGPVTANFDASGVPDGTGTVQFSLRVRNDGAAALYDVQVNDVLEGAGETQFGSYASQPVPGSGQYTVVPGSLTIASRTSATAAVNAGYTGRSANGGLLAPGASLSVGGEFTVQFNARIYLKGRTGILLNSATAAAAIVNGGIKAITDISTDGTEPDANNNGTASDDSTPTPVDTQMAALQLTKLVSTPRRLANGVFEIDYTVRVANIGNAAAPHLRLVDNLNCAFGMDATDSRIAAWTLVGTPRSKSGLLTPATSFTGNTPCNRAAESGQPSQIPTEIALSLTDGTRAFPPGATEEISFTVRATVKPEYLGRGAVVVNKAWAGAFATNTVNASQLVQASAATVDSLLIDPQGVVYNAITRAPVPGAMVTFTRSSCLSGGVTPMTADQIYGGDSGAYTYNANGSVSMTTGADGQYQFFFRSPPVQNLCDYTLNVVPPAGTGLSLPSTTIPPQTGTFTSCGAIVPSATAPADGADTRYFMSLRAGLDSTTGTACEATHNHIPLEQGTANGLLLRKLGTKKTAEFGDFVDYVLTVTNKTAGPLTGVSFNDQLPVGFAYVKGSTRVNNQAVADPSGGIGPKLTFSLPNVVLAKDASATVRYRLRIGVGATIGADAINRAYAISGAARSNEASWRVSVTGGVFSDDAYAFGKVYLACPRADGEFDPESKKGVPGVRIFMEDGTSATTDVDGKWSLYGLKSVTHVLKVDATTLPRGATLILLDNRNAGAPDSRFLDVKKGEFMRADFVISDCGDVGRISQITQEIADRREAVAKQQKGDVGEDAAYKTRLTVDSTIITSGDTRSLPASGQLSGAGAVSSGMDQSRPLIDLPLSSSGSSTPLGAIGPQQSGAPVYNPLPKRPDGGADLLGPQPAPGIIDLETVLPNEDNKPGFIGLKSGDTVPSRTTNVRVKGPFGSVLRLSLNGEEIVERRVGKKATLQSKNVVAWEYIGVQLKPGQNELRLRIVDDFGNERANEVVNVVAPDKLGRIEIDVPEGARADLRTPINVRVRLVDANGVPVTARTQVTLETDRGRWLDTDLSPGEPGTQVFIEGGSASFTYIPPGEPGDVRVRASSGLLVQESRMVLLPEQRPMSGIGIVEGVIDFSGRGKPVTLGAQAAGSAFESELGHIAGGKDGDGARAGGRAAFYFKGTVRGDYLLTTAFDSDKTTRERLFRDIRPDEFYPVYGDNSVRGFDAQSTQKVYVRIDKNRSYLLYGDFTTASSTEVRQLSQVSRTLTGLKNQYDSGGIRATSFASYDSLKQRVEEQRGLGISGPYYLSGASTGDLLANSEKVEILVRDRNQPSAILKTTAMSRFTDYTIEPLSARILFLQPIASMDENFNPQSIRVTYEVDEGGPKFLVAGTDLQFKVTERLQLGVVAAKDDNPDNRRKLYALTGIGRLGEKTVIAAEAVRTDTELAGTGSASRIELRHEDADLKIQAQALKTSTGFDNLSASSSAGRTEGTARAEYALSGATRLRAEALYGKTDSIGASTSADTTNRSLTGTVQHKLGDAVVLEGAVRHGNQTGTAAGSFDYGQVAGSTTSNNGATGGTSAVGTISGAGTSQTESTTTVRGRITTQVPFMPQFQVFGEVEQDVDHSDRHAAALGGSYAITDKTRLYGRYAFVDSLTSLQNVTGATQRNVALFGVESNYMEGARAYNEYRLSDVSDGRSVQAAMGLRNTFKVTENLRLTGGYEQTQDLGNSPASVTTTSSSAATGVTDSNARAIVGGFEYTLGALRTVGTLEKRSASASDTLLGTLGASYRFEPDWTFLTRSVVNRTASTDTLLQMRQQFGLAYRPSGGADPWNALARYEHKYEHLTAGASSTLVEDDSKISASDVSTISTLSTPGISRTHIVSGNLNYNPARGEYWSARYAFRYTTLSDSIMSSSYWAQLGHVRYTRDIAKDWDLGVQAGLLYGKGGAVQRTLGFEAGYQAMPNLWVSAGYNVLGLKDPDLAGADYTNRGLYMRLRFKFDEGTLGLQSPAVPADGGTTAQVAPAGSGIGEVAAARAALAPVPATVAARPWQAGQPLPARIEWTEAQLFGAGSEELTDAGRRSLDALASAIGPAGIGQVDVSVGHGDTDAAHTGLWLARASAIKRALAGHSPRAISVSVDSQPLAPATAAATAANEAGVRPLVVAVVAARSN